MRCFVSGRGLQKNSFESSVLSNTFITRKVLQKHNYSIIINNDTSYNNSNNGNNDVNIKHNNIQVIMMLMYCFIIVINIMIT